MAEDKKSINKTLNKHYKSPYGYLESSIAFLCRIYPNDADLGKIIRKHFQKL